MENNISKNSRNRQNILIFCNIIFILLLIYQALGFFPIAPVESDGIGVANGVVEMAQKGLGESQIAYNYLVQPGTYVFVLLFYKITGADPFALYSVLCAIACVCFVILGSMLLNKITCYPIAICGLVMLLFQETMAGGYYPNSTVLAAPFAFLALYITANYRNLFPLLLAGLFMALAGWVRFDAFLVAPACLALLYDQKLKPAILKTMFVAGVTVLAAFLFLYFSGSGFDKILADTGAIKGIQNYSLVAADEKAGLEISHYIKTLIVFFPILLVYLSCIGFLHIIASRRWKFIMLYIMGVAPSVLAHFTTFDTPKRLYICLPFLALPALLSFNLFKQSSQNIRKVLIILGSVIFVSQYVIGLTVSFANKPWSSKPCPQIASLFTWKPVLKQTNSLSLVLGAGNVIATGDYLRLSSGLFWSPLFWFFEKKQFNDDLNILKRYFKKSYPSSLHILATTHEMKQIANRLLINDNYELANYVKGLYSLLVWKKGRHTVSIHYYEYYGEDYEGLEKAIMLMNVNKFTWLSECVWQHPLLLKRVSQYSQINNYGYEVKM